MNIILFTGANTYQINQQIKKIIKKENVDSLASVKYDCGETNIDEVLNDCETLPFLSDKKIIVVTQPVFLSSEKYKIEHNIDRFIEYVKNPNPSTLLIINASGIKLDKRLTVTKKLTKNAKHFNYDNLTEHEAQTLIEDTMKELNVKISYKAVNELIVRTECDALKLHSELNKLSFYLENQEEITLEDIKLLVCQPLENNVFTLTNLFLERKIEEAIKVYYQLLMNNQEPIVFSSILANNFHLVYIIKQYQKQFLTERDTQKKLKIHPYRMSKLYQIAKKINEDTIIQNIQALKNYDYHVKSGQVDKYLGFELLILNMS